MFSSLLIYPRNQNYLIDYLQNLMENRTISVVRSYAIISYDGTSQDAIQELNRKSLSCAVSNFSLKTPIRSKCFLLNSNPLK